MREERSETFLHRNFIKGMDSVNIEHLRIYYTLEYLQNVEQEGYIVKNQKGDKYIITKKGKELRDRPYIPKEK